MKNKQIALVSLSKSSERERRRRKKTKAFAKYFALLANAIRGNNVQLPFLDTCLGCPNR